MTKPNWYAEKWTDAENKEMADSKTQGAAASMITRTGVYINYYGDDFKGLGVRAKNSSDSWEDTEKLARFTKKFPFFQPIKGDGFCGLHSGIVGTLAKCVDDPYHFKQFKDNLAKWLDDLPADKKAKVQETIEKVLARITQENLSYQQFYDLVNQRSDTDNISKQLSVALYLNADLESFHEDLDMQNSAKPTRISEVNSITAGAVGHILKPISPFEIIAIAAESIDAILGQDLREDSVYIVGAGGHFDLLHSQLDYNLMAEIAKIELNLAKKNKVNSEEESKSFEEALKLKKESQTEEFYKKKVDKIWNLLPLEDQTRLDNFGFEKYKKSEIENEIFTDSSRGLGALSKEGQNLFNQLRDTIKTCEDAIKRIAYNNSKKARPKTRYDDDIIAQSTNRDYQITIAETIGRIRSHQQDAIFVGEVQNKLAKTNPAEFYRSTLPAIIDDHKTCKSGSTLSSAITNQNADGSIDITTANLGDSRVAVTLKYKKNGAVGYRSILLTEDHKPDLARVNAHINGQGGSIVNGRVNRMLAVGGAIGDASVLIEEEDCLLRTPDIWNFNSKKFLQPEETLEDLDLIVGCDGLWDRSGKPSIMSTDKEFVLEGDKFKLKTNTTKNISHHLTDLRKEFDNLADKSTYENNFAYYLQQKAIDGGSTDNISASNITLVSEGKTIIPADKSVMLSVCDGHGGKPDSSYEDNKANLAGSNLVKTANDGALVAASVAARLANAAQIEEIKGLEIQQQKQESLFLLKQQYSKEPTIIAKTERQKSTTRATKKKDTPPPSTPDNDEGHTTKEGKSDDEFEVSSTFQSIKARNKPTFAYTDREIDAVNRARNIAAGYKYFKNKKGEESGILLRSDDKPLAGSDDIKTIIEMPACAVDQGSPISLYLAAQLEHLKDFTKTKTNSNPYPVKILFPYKLQAWHWNVGEVTVTQEGGELVLAGCAYDSMNKAADLEIKIQQEILNTFEASFPGQISIQNHLNKKSASTEAPQKGGIACGLYAGIAMHNLKTKPAAEVWDGTNEDEQALRDKDSNLVFLHNPNSRFCEAINERGFVDIFRTKDKTTTNTSSSSSKTHYHAMAREMARELEKIPSDTLLSIASLAEKSAFNVDSGTAYKALLAELESYKTLHNIIFPNGASSKTIPNYQLANLAFEATLARTQETSSSPSKEETAYQNCLEIISGSFADVVRDCAIRSPSSLVESLKKTDNLTDEEKALQGFLEGLKRHIEDTAPKDKKDDLFKTSELVARMICLEVQETRISEITKMKSNALNIIEKSTPLNEEEKFLVDNFATSNNPILEKDGKNYTPLAAAKEKFTAAKQELHKKLEEKIESHKIESGDSKEAKHTFSEEDIIKYSAKGILSKALRAKAIEEIAVTQEGKKKNLVNKITFETVGNTYDEATDGSGNLKIQFGRRYVRKNFVGVPEKTLKFNDSNFGNNSFANCTFTNCDFTGSSGKQLKFVNCTFGEGCVIPEDLKTLKMNFAGCKFNKKIFEGMTNADELKTKLGIPKDAVDKDGFYQSEKPSASISSGAAFKLNPKMLTR